MTDSNDDPPPPAPSAGRKARTDGKVYCCATLGYVDLDTFFDHRWETSRGRDDDTLVDVRTEAPDPS